jgi:hypothetical protein
VGLELNQTGVRLATRKYETWSPNLQGGGNLSLASPIVFTLTTDRELLLALSQLSRLAELLVPQGPPCSHHAHGAAGKETLGCPSLFSSIERRPNASEE